MNYALGTCLQLQNNRSHPDFASQKKKERSKKDLKTNQATDYFGYQNETLKATGKSSVTSTVATFSLIKSSYEYQNVSHILITRFCRNRRNISKKVFILPWNKMFSYKMQPKVKMNLFQSGSRTDRGTAKNHISSFYN